MMFSNVVFPLPEGPNTTTRSSAATRNDTSAKATTSFEADRVAAPDTGQLHQHIRGGPDSK
jgi:hypothetical protein